MSNEIPVIRARLSNDTPQIPAKVLTDEQIRSAGVNPAILKGKDGKSPIIGDNQNWWTYDDVAGTWIDSGIPSVVSVEGAVPTILQAQSVEEFPETGKTNGIYITTEGSIYRWDEENCCYENCQRVVNTDKNYVHVQSTASDTWEISHNLAKFPSITVVDSAGSVVIGEIEYMNINKVIIRFRGAFSGKAICN